MESVERVENVVLDVAREDASSAGAVVQRWEREQDFDRAMLRWMLRFAFTTASVLSERWGVSEQRIRARLRRLERDGLIERMRHGPNEPARVVVSERAAELFGLSQRTPDGREPLGHELAIIKRVIAIERHFAENGPATARVLTERDMRRAATANRTRPLWVPYTRTRGRQGRRRADYVVDTPDGRTAVELEFSMKGTNRLRSIVRGYLQSEAFDFVDFVVLDSDEDAPLPRLLRRLLEEEQTTELAARLPGLPIKPPTIRVVPWRDPLPHLHAGVRPFPAMQSDDPAVAIGG